MKEKQNYKKNMPHFSPEYDSKQFLKHTVDTYSIYFFTLTIFNVHIFLFIYCTHTGDK
jgi:hypothetical protein